MRKFRFSPVLSHTLSFTLGDGLILLGLVALLYAGARLAFSSPEVISGPDISLSPLALPWYALLSVGRMAAAYFFSLTFSLFYGYAAARNRNARVVLMPLLDVLQSVPILSFLPVVLLSLTAILPDAFAAELAAIVLIFTSQAWNMTFSFYQSLSTIPKELHEAAAIYGFSPWLRFRTLELPFAAIGLLWNSVMSWSGGWFFLMAAEIFHTGKRDFRLPGLGSYLQTAANQGNLPAVVMGVVVLVVVIVLLDQLVWRPLMAWADKFKLEMVEGEEPPTSWFFDLLSGSWIVAKFKEHIMFPVSDTLDRWFQGRPGATILSPEEEGGGQAPLSRLLKISLGSIAMVSVYGGYRAMEMLLSLPLAAWEQLGIGLLATSGRVAASLVIALLWTVPLGVLIGTNRRLANILQPIVQVVAAIPATALFPVLLLALLQISGGLNIAAIALMLMGTQWYILFNVIAGAAGIPQDLHATTDLLRLSTFDRWKTLILPALFPHIVTGAITASGGAWNASIVAEHVMFAGETHSTVGVGALIAQATSEGNYPLLLAATLILVSTVVLFNRVFWRRLYRLAEERYRME